MRLGNGVIVAALLAIAPSIAAADSKVYVDIAGGANFLEATDISGTGLGTEADFDTGFAVKAAIEEIGAVVRAQFRHSHAKLRRDRLAGGDEANPEGKETPEGKEPDHRHRLSALGISLRTL